MDFYTKAIKDICNNRFLIVKITPLFNSLENSNSCKTEEYPSNRCNLIKSNNKDDSFKGYNSTE
jgi:hypothetical protein